MNHEFYTAEITADKTFGESFVLVAGEKNHECNLSAYIYLTGTRRTRHMYKAYNVCILISRTGRAPFYILYLHSFNVVRSTKSDGSNVHTYARP